ncbi:MAG: UvrD-helicase domain-containing protein [Burkholderiales bacterium]|nr:MAG: UvrD-helicase domain-containing protein [Burkholderiales bacterium]
MSAGLNPAQLEAVRYLDGPCLVLAGAGSGKTRVITHKLAHLVRAGIEPRHVAAITFTNKAAQEMAERVCAMVPVAEGNRPLISTFHALGVRILRREAGAIGLKPGFSIFDTADQHGLMQQSLATTDGSLVRGALRRISLWKNALVGPETALATAADTFEQRAARAYLDYEATLRAYQAVDFDDLIKRPVELFRDAPQALERWQGELRYLLVDEYQDTNASQYELLKLLVGTRGAFTAVGDDDQSIYGWRGATLDNMRRLAVDFPRLRTIALEQNYRSSLRILAAANALIAGNPKLHEKRLWSSLGLGDPVQVLEMDSDQHEAESIVIRLQAHKFERRTRFADYAILYRGNHQARVFEQALRRERIPYQLSGGQSFFERTEVRDLCAYLRLLANDDDDPAFVRAITTPKRGVGNATLTALGQYAGERHRSLFAALFETGIESRLAARQLAPLRELGDFVNRFAWRAQREPAAPVLDDLIGAIDYRAHLFELHSEREAAVRWQNASDFVDWLRQRAEADRVTLLELAQKVALMSRLDQEARESDAVRLSTLHAAKGLEFPHVFIAGVEEGLLPHLGDGARAARDDRAVEHRAANPARTTGNRGAGAPGTVAQATAADADEPDDSRDQAARIEEERRLMYVGITRAQKSLTVSWCRKRKRGRELFEREPSRFIAEMQLDRAPGTEPGAGGQAVAEDRPLTPRERLARMKELMLTAPRAPQRAAD